VVILVLAFSLTRALAGSSWPAPDPTPAPRAGAEAPQSTTPDVAVGLQVYSALCVGCHGPTGVGVGGIDLRRGPLPRASTDAALRAIITRGVPASGMPAFRLGPTELAGLVAFIRVGFEATTSVTVAVGDPGRGRLLFEGRGNCLSCHRVNDRGQYLAPDLTEIGRVRTPAALQRSLIDPTGSMLPINRPVRAITRDGVAIQGRRLNEDTYTVQIVNEQGRLVSLVKAELREWSVSTTSPMPSYKDLLMPSELSDLVGYLASLKGTRP
jgi:putative heme-binding domain-containing protein